MLEQSVMCFRNPMHIEEDRSYKIGKLLHWG
jgi:hypothetical protein